MEKNEITIADLFRSLLRHLPIILVVTFVFGIATWAYSNFMITPKYTATSKMIAISNPDRTTGIYTSAEHNAAVAFVNTTAAVMKTASILDETAMRLSEQGLNYTGKQLKNMVSITSENETEVFHVTVTGTKKNDVAMIANVLSKVAEERVGDLSEAGRVKELEPAATPNGPSSPNKTRNTILGALIGFVLISLIVILRDLYDTTIWTEEDLTAHYKYPVLGLIPQLEENGGDAKAREA